MGLRETMSAIPNDLVADALERVNPTDLAQARTELLQRAGLAESELSPLRQGAFSDVLKNQAVAGGEVVGPEGLQRSDLSAYTLAENASAENKSDQPNNPEGLDYPRLTAVGEAASALQVENDQPKDGSARAFEAFVLTSLIEVMLPRSGSFFGSGAGTEIWRSMFAQQLADEISAGGGIGLAEIMENRGVPNEAHADASTTTARIA